jgi:hypothetical protein
MFVAGPSFNYHLWRPCVPLTSPNFSIVCGLMIIFVMSSIKVRSICSIFYNKNKPHNYYPNKGEDNVLAFYCDLVFYFVNTPVQTSIG